MLSVTLHHTLPEFHAFIILKWHDNVHENALKQMFSIMIFKDSLCAYCLLVLQFLNAWTWPSTLKPEFLEFRFFCLFVSVLVITAFCYSYLKTLLLFNFLFATLFSLSHACCNVICNWHTSLTTWWTLTRCPSSWSFELLESSTPQDALSRADQVPPAHTHCISDRVMNYLLTYLLTLLSSIDHCCQSANLMSPNQIKFILLCINKPFLILHLVISHFNSVACGNLIGP